MKLQSIAFALMMLLFAVTIRAADDPLIGTWKLNVAKSSPPGAPSQSSTIKREPLPNGFKSITDSVNPQGKATHYDYTAYYDGKEYPVKGDPARDTVSMKRVDSRTVDTISKKDGKVTSNTQFKVAPDGKTMATTIKSKNAQGEEQTRVLFYDKQ